MSAALVGLADIGIAVERIRGVALRTPLLEVSLDRDVDRGGGSSGLPDRALRLKCENFQPMGAFKIRGAYNMLAQLSPEARAAGVVTYSSGNHGQAVALAAERLGIPAVIVMPETAPRVKIDGVRRYGGEVIFAGTTSVDRRVRAEAEAAARGLTIVPPFDHPWIVAGAGTCGLEILDQYPDVTAVYVPVGGGGLISGIAAAIKGSGHAARVIGVEPTGAAKMSASRAAGRPVRLERTSSIADGLLPLQPSDLTFAHVQALVDDLVTVDDAAIAGAVRWLFREARIVAEPSGAASVAAVLQAGASIAPGTVAVISGGNVSAADYTRYIM
ncbi:MAG: threonine/serine dehydratase [Acidobacteria bacterium]|nr:threonine/serine dehydratase [Acidobacteriota bacterium]